MCEPGEVFSENTVNKWIPLGLLQNGFSENIRIKISLVLSKPLIKTYRKKANIECGNLIVVNTVSL